MREVTVTIKALVEDATPPISPEDYWYKINSKVDCFYDMFVQDIEIAE